MDRVVFDSNVYISMAMGSKTAKRAFRQISDQNRLYISSHILGEVSQKLITRLKMPEHQSDRIVSKIYKATNRVTPVDVAFDSCRDVNDLPVLGTALAAQAKHLVTFDNDLLVLERFKNSKILRLGDFFNVLSVEPACLLSWPTFADIWKPAESEISNESLAIA